MFSLQHRPAILCDGVSRREWLRLGGLSLMGLSLPELLRAEASAAPPAATPRLGAQLGGATFGRAKSVIFLWLQGGPPQHETFDPKPDAPEQIRGLFKPIATNVPGIRISELLPRTAQIADRLAIVRSMSTKDDNHDVSGYWILTGYPYGPGSARQIKPTDWPYFGSIVKMLKPSEKLPALTSVWIPDQMRLNDNVTPAGQTAGFLGKLWEPDRFVGDPASRDFRIEGLSLQPDLSLVRVRRRHELLDQLESHFRTVERAPALEAWDAHAQQAYDLVTSGRARDAFDLRKEPDKLRERYGRHSWGQTVLLARRLVEAGVRLVHVNWTREPGDSAVDNPMWDTHAQNADRLQDALCPQFDVGFTALIEDLETRGLLSETLVVAIGEFGRTPRINKQGGRDHWGHVFSFALAGAGISGGQVLGSSDKNGGYPSTNPIWPHDLTATIFHLLGIDPTGVFYDKTKRPNLLTKGEPLYTLLGQAPATTARCEPGGDMNFVPPYDDRLLLNTDFKSGQALIAAGTSTRTKGWRATPLEPAGAPLLVRQSGDKKPHVELRIDFARQAAAGSKESAKQAVLAQEIRNARGGQYTFTATISTAASSLDCYEKLFKEQCTCRLVLFRYKSLAKDPRDVDVLAATEFVPVLDGADKKQQFTVTRFLGSTKSNVNFPIGNGLGVAIELERTSPESPEPRQAKTGWASIRIHEVALAFTARPIDETVVD